MVSFHPLPIRKRHRDNPKSQLQKGTQARTAASSAFSSEVVNAHQIVLPEQSIEPAGAAHRNQCFQ